jgi:hypothetical protein
LIVVRKTDLLAAAAFILSVSTAAYQLWGFARGANVTLYHPDTVYIYFDLYANGITATRFAGQVSLINSGEAGQNAIVRDLSLAIDVGATKFEEHWLSFAVVSRKSTALVIEPKESAHPLLVAGGSAVGQLVTFSPRVRDCGQHASELNTRRRHRFVLRQNQPAGDGTNREPCSDTADYISDTSFLSELSARNRIKLKFSGTLVGSEKLLESSCSIAITPDLQSTLAENDWYAAKCSSDAK